MPAKKTAAPDVAAAPAPAPVDRVLIGPKTVIISPSIWKQVQAIIVKQPYEVAAPIIEAVEYFDPQIPDGDVE